MSARARARLVALMSAVALLVACGLPEDSSPRVLAPEKVPYNLLGSSTTIAGDQPGGDEVELYFVKGERLGIATRRLTDSSTKAVLEALIKGPADGDPGGLTGAIAPETRVLRVDLAERTLTIVLTSDVLAVTGPLQKSAFAQFVYTATSLPGIREIRFKIAEADGSNERDVDPPTDSGAKQGPLTKNDYPSLSPLS